MDARKWLKKRTKVQIFLATIMLSTSISTTFLSIATQQFAKSQNYHPALNQISSPIIGHYYNPLAIAAWKKQYYEQAKEDFDIVMPKIYLGFGIGVIILFAGVLILKGKKTALTTHGSARWATEEELDQTGLTKPEGVMLGVTKGGKYIRHNGAEHIICYAPTRCLIEDTEIVVKHHHIIYDEEIKNLKKGMSVWTGHEWSKVIWHKKTKRPKQAVKLTFENGKEEICTINHKWPTTNGMVLTENLLVGDQLLEIACNPFDMNESMEDFDKKFLEAFKNKKTTKPIKIISIENITTDKDFYNITIKDEPHIYMLSSGVYTGNSGKGVGIIIPTLLAWVHSVVVTDIKGENWGITSGYRKAKLKNKVIKFDPTCVDGSGARYNPLEEIRVGTPDEVKDTQRIVTMIVDTGGKGELDHWGKTASALLLGLILYVLYCEEEKNLSRVADIINNPEEEDIGESLRMMAERNHANPSLMKQIYGVETSVHPKIWNSLLECSNKPDNERGSVISTAVSNLALYRDPIIAHNISKSDFKISDLMNYDDNKIYQDEFANSINKSKKIVIIGKKNKNIKDECNVTYGLRNIWDNSKHKYKIIISSNKKIMEWKTTDIVLFKTKHDETYDSNQKKSHESSKNKSFIDKALSILNITINKILSLLKTNAINKTNHRDINELSSIFVRKNEASVLIYINKDDLETRTETIKSIIETLTDNSNKGIQLIVDDTNILLNNAFKEFVQGHAFDEISYCFVFNSVTTLHKHNLSIEHLYADNITFFKCNDVESNILANKLASNTKSSVLLQSLKVSEHYSFKINNGVYKHITGYLKDKPMPVSLYIVIPPSDLDRVVPLTRIIINQIITSLTEKMEFVDGKPVVAYKHKLLLLIDEFPAFGKIESLEKALAFIAGYGLKALLIIQSLNQINKAYTKDNSILDNCHIRIAYTPNDNHTAEEISKSLGESTILVDSYGYDKGFNFMGPRKTGRSGQSRKLMTAGEVMVMPPDDEIVFVAGFPPYKAKKIFYWKDHNFKKRLLSAPPKSDVTQYRPEAEEGEDDVTLSMSDFRNDLSEIAMSIDDLPPMMQHPFNSQPNMLVEPEIETDIPDTHDYDNIEMIQRLLNNAPTDESREDAINNNSFVDSYDDLAYIDFDQLEREADEIAVM